MFMSNMINNLSKMVGQGKPGAGEGSDDKAGDKSPSIGDAAKGITSAMQTKPTKMSDFLK